MSGSGEFASSIEGEHHSLQKIKAKLNKDDSNSFHEMMLTNKIYATKLL